MVWQGERPLVLASQSRARGALLGNAGITYEAIPADIDERGIQQASKLAAPGAVAALLAREKARAVAALHPGRIVLGADQTLALGLRLFDKPADRDAAFAQLRALAGRTHELHAAFALMRDGSVLDEGVAIARMTMRALDDAAIARYLDAAGEAVTTTVGAYQLEGVGVHLFARIDGDHFTILGLPLLLLLDGLRRQGLMGL